LKKAIMPHMGETKGASFASRLKRLMGSMSPRHIARELDVSEGTVYQWLAVPVFPDESIGDSPRGAVSVRAVRIGGSARLVVPGGPQALQRRRSRHSRRCSAPSPPTPAGLLHNVDILHGVAPISRERVTKTERHKHARIISRKVSYKVVCKPCDIGYTTIDRRGPWKQQAEGQSRHTRRE
jgi:hypothetical protein